MRRKYPIYEKAKEKIEQILDPVLRSVATRVNNWFLDNPTDLEDLPIVIAKMLRERGVK